MPDGGLSTGICSGTKLLQEADADVATRQTFPFLPPVGRLYGTVERSVRPSPESSARSEPAAGIAIAITAGGTRLQGVTDPSGNFEITQVPPGTYKVRALVPDTIRTSGDVAIDVPARGCARVQVSMVSNGRVSGRLRLADGTPVARLEVDLRLAPLDGSNSRVDVEWHSQYSDSQGRFAFDGIVPGRYYLGVNAQCGASLRSPYLPRYYPDAVDPAGAYVIDLGDGEEKTGFDFTLTPLAETVINGVVIDADGKPLAGIVVGLNAVSGNFSSYARANLEGEFQLRGLRGQPYKLTAGITSITVVATDVPQAVTIVSAPDTPAGPRSPAAPAPTPLYPPKRRFRIVFPLWPDVNPQSSIR